MKGWWIIGLVLMSFCACSPAKRVAVRKEAGHLGEAKVMRLIDANQLDFSTLQSRRVEMSVRMNGKQVGLHGVLRIKRDSFIWFSVLAPLGIEVAKVYLTPDSVRFMDSFHKQYFLTDYSFFDDKFGIGLTYGCIQNLLTNVFFNLEDCSGGLSKNSRFKFERTDSDFAFSNLQKKGLNRKVKKWMKKKRKNKDYALVLQKIQVDPEFFRPYKLTLEDMDEEIGITADYADFKETGGKFFPERFTLSTNFEDNEIDVTLQFTKLEFDTPVKPVFRVPSKYKRMNVVIGE